MVVINPPPCLNSLDLQRSDLLSNGRRLSCECIEARDQQSSNSQYPFHLTLKISTSTLTFKDECKPTSIQFPFGQMHFAWLPSTKANILTDLQLKLEKASRHLPNLPPSVAPVVSRNRPLNNLHQQSGGVPVQLVQAWPRRILS